jgi:enoyl-CoA hydratase
MNARSNFRPGDGAAVRASWPPDEPHVSVARTGRIATVTIDSPPVNALTFDDYDSIRRVFQSFAGDEEISAVVLTGAGTRAFVGGHDVNEFVAMSAEVAEQGLARVRMAFNAVEDCAVPVVAAINGPAIGAGFALASLSDIRVCSEKAFLSVPEIDVGVLGSGSHLMRLAPQGMTRLMVLTGRRLHARDALAAGVVEQVCAPGDVLDGALEIAREIARKSPAAVRFAKAGLNRVERMSAREGYEFECTLTNALRRSPDAVEAGRSFVEKRPPSFAEGPSPSE